MFYRIKFDGVVGKVLNQAGYLSTDEKFEVWPAGLTSHLVSQAKSIKLDAKTAAYLGICKYFSEGSEISSSAKKSILSAALLYASQDKGIGQDVCLKIRDCIRQFE